MRKLLTLAALLFSISLWAADGTNERWRISILAAEISTEGDNTFAGHEVPATDARPGVGVGLAYAPTPQWDVELTAALQTYTSPYTRLTYMPAAGQPGMFVPVTEFRQYRVHPLDLTATRHFLTARSIAPYLRAGLRYVDAPGPAMQIGTTVLPGEPPPYVSVTEGYYGFADRLSAQAGAGVRVRMTPRAAFRAEVNRLLRSEKIDFDPLTRFSLGVSVDF